MSKCMKKMKTSAVVEPTDAGLDRLATGRCAKSAHIVDIDTAVTVLLCDEHHVELSAEVVEKARVLRRWKTQLMAVVCGYANPDIEMGDIGEQLDAVEAAEDELAELVLLWMESTDEEASK